MNGSFLAKRYHSMVFMVRAIICLMYFPTARITTDGCILLLFTNMMSQPLLKDRNYPLYESLRLFSAETLKVIEAAVNAGARIHTISQFTWQTEEQANSFARRPLEKPEYWILVHKLDSSIKALGTYHTAMKEVQSDFLWGSHIDKMVGSTMSRQRLSLNGLLIGIPAYSLNISNQLGWSEQCFEERIDELERFFLSPTVEHVKTTPLYGITLQKELSISESISIVPITADSALELLNDGLEPPRMFSTDTDFVHDFPLAAIVTRFALPKRVVDGDELQKNLNSLREKLNRLSIDQDIIIDLLILIFGTAIRPLGSITKSRGFMSWSRSIQKNEISNIWVLPEKSFEEEDQKKLNGLWPIFDGSNKKPWHFLVIAVRRFSLAMTRTSLDDKLIDLMICAEAIFLRVEQNELSDKLAYRAALLLGKSSEQQKEIFKFFKEAYTMRSKVVHGSKSYMREAKDAEKLAATATELAEHLRNAILNMLDLALNPQAPSELIDWKVLMFPENQIVK